MAYLAQLNIARLRHPQDDPRVAEFIDNIDRVNALAEAADGFVWRLQDDSGNATGIRMFDDDQMIVNMSLWRDAQSLEHFVWRTVHKRFYGQRGDWFEKSEGPSLVMWWVEEDHRPDVTEAAERLQHLADHGPSDHAFGWKSLPQVEMWKSARCA